MGEAATTYWGQQIFSGHIWWPLMAKGRTVNTCCQGHLSHMRYFTYGFERVIKVADYADMSQTVRTHKMLNTDC